MAGIGEGSGSGSDPSVPDYEEVEVDFVSQRLSAENYEKWRRDVHFALLVKEKFCFVDGSTPIPGDMATEPGEYRHWIEENNLVIGWLLNNMEMEVVESVACYTSAAEIWKYLKDRFTKRDALSLFRAQKDLMTLTQERNSLKHYLFFFKVLLEEVKDKRPTKHCTCGAMDSLLDHLDKVMVVQFLMGLNNVFDDVRANILAMDPLPPLDEVYALLVADEQERFK